MNSSSLTTGLLLLALVLPWTVAPAAAAPRSTGDNDPVASTLASNAPEPSTPGLSFGEAVVLLERNNRSLMAAADRENARRQERSAARDYDTFIDEVTLLQLYGATNVMLLPYLNQQHISSGIRHRTRL